MDGVATKAGRRTSLAVRTAVGVVVLLAVVLSVFTLTSLALTARTVDKHLEQNVRQAWYRSYVYLHHGFATEEPDFTRSPLDASGQPAEMLVLVMNDGQVAQASRLDEREDIVALSPEDVARLTALAEETVQAQAAQDARLAGLPEDERERVLDVELIRSMDLDRGQFLVQGEVVDDHDGVAVIGLPTADADRTKDSLARVQVFGSLAALMLAGLLAWWWIRRSLRPLGEVSHAAARVADVPMGSGEVSLARYRVRGELAEPGDEVGDVAFTLNRLIDSVDGAFEQRNRSEQRLRTFVADASHELRTPLAAVRGYAEIVGLTEPLTDSGRDALSRVLQQSDRMGTLVDDLLLLARLDAGRPHRSGEVDLGELVVDAVLDATAAGRDHTWTVDVPEGPVTVIGDRQQLAQMVANLLANARKHTPAGTAVHVRLASGGARGPGDDGAPDSDGVPEDGRAAGPGDGTARELDPGAVPRPDDVGARSVAEPEVSSSAEPAMGTVRLTVQDDGPGIDPELLPGLFDRFVRGDTARATREGSTGLGLSIVRSVARAHRGEASVESVPGRTVFTVELPASRPSGGARWE